MTYTIPQESQSRKNWNAVILLNNFKQFCNYLLKFFLKIVKKTFQCKLETRGLSRTGNL